MPTLVFKIAADYEAVIRLREEISKLEAQLKKMDVNKSPAAAKALETQLASTRQQMMGLVTEAAKAGAVMEKDFKSNIYNASQSVNDFTQKIIDQKRVVKDVEHDVKRLGDAYKTALKRNPTGAAGLLSEYQSAKKTLDEEKATLFGLTQQQAEARLSVKRLKDEYAAFKEEAGETVEANEKMSVSLTKVLGVIGGVTALKNFATELVNVRGQFQQLEISFSTMLKSKEKADKLMSELVDIAAKTPFDLQGVASSAKQMIAYGSSAENVGDELVMLGNVAAGVGSQLSEIAYLYGTLRTQGRAYAVDIRQFAGRGIPIYEELAKVLGVTKDKVSELVKEGKVGFKEVEQAFKNMTSESGIYYNLMEEQSKSLTGQLSNLGDAWDSMLNEIGKNTQGIASSGISALKGLVENYETVGKVILGLIATYGTYKTALFVARITQDILTARMQFAIVVAKAQTAAQTVLNTVMKANPYVLVATAVVGLVSAMWALYDGTSAAEKAQKRFNDEQQKFIDREEERKRKVEELIRVIQDNTETEYTRIKAYEELQRYSPALVSAYSREEIATLNLANAQKKLNEERDKNNYQNIIANIEKAKNGIQKYTKARQTASLNPNSNNQVAIYTSKIEDAKKDLDKWQSALNELNRLKKQAEEDAKPVEVKLMEAESNREQIVQEYNAARQALQEAQEKLKNTPFAQIPFEIQLRFNNAQKAMNESDNLIAGLKSEQSKSDKSYKDAYNEAKKEYEAKLKAVEDAKKSTEKEYKKAVEELETAEKKYKELGGVTGSKLDRQENQTAKREESIRKQTDILSTLEERQALERAREAVDLENQVEQARINAMADGNEKILAQRELDDKKELQAIDKAKQDYIQKEIQRQKEIFEATEELKAKQNPKYKKKIFDSSSVSIDTSVFDSIYSNTQKRQIQNNLKAKEDAWNEALIKFGDYNQKRKAIIEKYDKEIAAAQSAGEEWEKTEEKKAALESLDEQYGKSTRAMADLFEDASEKSVSSIQKIIDKYELLIKYLSGTKQSDNSSVTGDELKAAGFTDKDIEKIEKGEIQIKDVTDAVKGLKSELKGKSTWQSFVSDMEKGIEKLKTAAGDSGKIGEGIMNIGNAVTSFAPALGEFGNNIASIFGVDDSSITEITNAISGLGQTAAGVGSIMSGDIVGGVMGAVRGIASVIGAFRAIHDKKNEKQIQKLQDQIDVLDDSYNMLGRSIEKAYSTDASNLIDQQNELLEQQKLLIQQQIQEEKDKKKTDDERIKEWEQQLKDIDEQIQDNVEKAQEAIAGISFDSFRNNFLDSLTDMDAKAEDLADSFEEYLKKAILNGLMASKYDSQIKGLYEKWTAYGEDGLTEAEVEQLRKDYEDIANAMIADRDSLAQLYGWESESSSEQQSASSKGFEAMSQDTADELNGRFTAVYESNLRIETATQQQTVAITELRGSISALTSQVSGMYNIADETRTILANSYLELQQIRENTGEIVKPIKQIQADIAEVKQNTSRL